MPKANIAQALPAFKDPREGAELRRVLTATQEDLAALRAAFVALTAKLDTDAGVSGTDYAATTNPAQLNLLP